MLLMAPLLHPLTPPLTRPPQPAFILDRALDQALALDDLQCKSHARMPPNVAVHQPCARVVGFKGECEPAGGGHVGCVAAWGVA